MIKCVPILKQQENLGVKMSLNIRALCVWVILFFQFPISILNTWYAFKTWEQSRVLTFLLCLCTISMYILVLFIFIFIYLCFAGNNYTLIENEKNWCQALQYCRTYYSDLVSINNTVQNNTVTKLGKNTSFWIGLMHDEWEWRDNSCSTFRKWADRGGIDPEDNYYCTVHQGTVFKELLYKFQCQHEAFLFCSEGKW